jgi:hypothetical protein
LFVFRNNSGHTEDDGIVRFQEETTHPRRRSGSGSPLMEARFRIASEGARFRIAAE